MNYNIPYYGTIPISNAMTLPVRGASGGIFSRLLGGLNVGSILTNTQKTLNVINQVIPIVKQANPLLKNAKTMFRVMNEFKKIEDPTNNISFTSSNENTKQTTNNPNRKTDEVSNSVKGKEIISRGPVFFVK